MNEPNMQYHILSSSSPEKPQYDPKNKHNAVASNGFECHQRPQETDRLSLGDLNCNINLSLSNARETNGLTERGMRSQRVILLQSTAWADTVQTKATLTELLNFISRILLSLH